MKIGICATSINDNNINKELDYIGVDHGVEELIKQGVTPVYCIGDFDSIINESMLTNYNIKRLPSRKDVTDTHAAIDYAISKGYDEIDIYGVTGGRLDHFMAVICLLSKYRDTKITIYDNQNKIMLLKSGTYNIYKEDYKYFSIFAIDGSNISIKQAAYNLDNYLLKHNDPLCVSNEVVKDFAIIETDNDILLIKSRDK